MPVGRTVLAKPKVSAGQRDKLVRVETKAAVVATSGYPKDADWSPLRSVYMSREDVRGDERLTSGVGESAFLETQWQMPYMEEMDPDVVDVPSTKRLVYRNRVYNIRAASVMDRKIGIELLTLAQVG